MAIEDELEVEQRSVIFEQICGRGSIGNCCRLQQRADDDYDYSGECVREQVAALH